MILQSTLSYSFVVVFLVILLPHQLTPWPLSKYLYIRGSRYGYGRNIKPVDCYSKKGEQGVCMFAWDCMEANGTHLDICVERFYVGSCCDLKSKSQNAAHEDVNQVKDTEVKEENAQDQTSVLTPIHSTVEVEEETPDNTNDIVVNPDNGSDGSIIISTDIGISGGLSNIKPFNPTVDESLSDSSGTKPSKEKPEGQSSLLETGLEQDVINNLNIDTGSESAVPEKETTSGIQINIPDNSNLTVINTEIDSPVVTGNISDYIQGDESESTVPEGSQDSTVATEVIIEDQTSSSLDSVVAIENELGSETEVVDQIISGIVENIPDSDTTKPVKTTVLEEINDPEIVLAFGSDDENVEVRNQTIKEPTMEQNPSFADVDENKIPEETGNSDKETEVEEITIPSFGIMSPELDNTKEDIGPLAVNEGTQLLPESDNSGGTVKPENEEVKVVDEMSSVDHILETLLGGLMENDTESVSKPSTTDDDSLVSITEEFTSEITAVEYTTEKENDMTTESTYLVDDKNEATDNIVNVITFTEKPNEDEDKIPEIDIVGENIPDQNINEIVPGIQIQPSTGDDSGTNEISIVIPQDKIPIIPGGGLISKPITVDLLPSIGDITNPNAIQRVNITNNEQNIIDLINELSTSINTPVITTEPTSMKTTSSLSSSTGASSVSSTSSEILIIPEIDLFTSDSISVKPTDIKIQSTEVSPSETTTDIIYIPEGSELINTVQTSSADKSTVISTKPTESTLVETTIISTTEPPVVEKTTAKTEDSSVTKTQTTTEQSPTAILKPTSTEIYTLVEKSTTTTKISNVEGTSSPTMTIDTVQSTSVLTTLETIKSTVTIKPTDTIKITSTIKPTIILQPSTSTSQIDIIEQTLLTTTQSVSSTVTDTNNYEGEIEKVTESVTIDKPTVTNVPILFPDKPDKVTESPEVTNTTSPSLVDQEKALLERLKNADAKDICGTPIYPTRRIVGGSKAEYGEWPWQLSLRQWRNKLFLHKCGAALVNRNWAITAAHCVENIEPDKLLLVMGEYDLSTDTERYTHEERKVNLIAMHPKFESRTFEYDLALLRFLEPVEYKPNIIPICIPEDDFDFIGTTGYVSGWGRLYEEGPLPTVMQKVPVPVIPNDKCEDMYKAAGFVEHIPHIFLCAGYQQGEQDSCEGDSGGPMVIRYKGRYRLAGIISWGIGCALPNQPGVYTRISEFRNWIGKIVVF